MRVLEVWLGHSSFLFGSAPGHSLRVVPIARRGRAPSAALPALPGSGLPGERADKFPRRESERTGLRKLAAGGRGSRVRSHRLEAEPISPAPGFWRGPGPEHAPPAPQPSSQRPRATLQDLAPQSKRPALQASPKTARIPAPRDVCCRSRQGLPGPTPSTCGWPPPGPPGPARHAPPGPSASSARRAPQSLASAPAPSTLGQPGPAGTHLPWGCSSGHPEPGGGKGGAGERGQRGAPGTAAAGRLVLPSRGPAQRYK